MSKVIAVMDKTSNCQECVFGVCKYSLPLSTSRKGYYCQLLPPKKRIVHDFDYNSEVHIPECPLKPLPEHKPFIGEEAINSPFLDDRIDEALHQVAWMGWNACLDEMLK